MRPDLQIRDGIHGLIEQPQGNFRVLVQHALLDSILELAHTVAAHEGLKNPFSAFLVLYSGQACAVISCCMFHPALCMIDSITVDPILQILYIRLEYDSVDEFWQWISLEGRKHP